MTDFVRTEEGQRASYLFYPDPVLWVEGVEDIEMLASLATRYNFYLKAAGGKPECSKLCSSLASEGDPYVVLMDGDYDILAPRRSQHRRQLILRRYASENYLAEEQALESYCRALMRWQEPHSVLGSLFKELSNELETHLKILVVLDVAQQNRGLGVGVLPRSIEPLFAEPRDVKISQEAVNSIVNRVRPQIPDDAIQSALSDVEKYLQNGRFLDLLEGHLVFGALRRLIFTIFHRSQQRLNADDRSLRVGLSSYVWSLIPSREHARLRDRIRDATAEARRLRRAGDPRVQVT